MSWQQIGWDGVWDYVDTPTEKEAELLKHISNHGAYSSGKKKKTIQNKIDKFFRYFGKKCNYKVHSTTAR